MQVCLPLRACSALLIVLLLAAAEVRAADLVRLGRENWREFAPRGKEVDCIYGDFVLKNGQIVVVVAQPKAGRNANMTVKNVGGAIIDLTRARGQSDQLSAFYPGGGQYEFTSPAGIAVKVDGENQAADFSRLSGASVSLSCKSTRKANQADVVVRYTLDDDARHVAVETVFTNPHDSALKVELGDSMRADRTFEFGQDEDANLFWAYDEWFRQAYGIVAEGRGVRRSQARRGVAIEYVADGRTSLELAPGESYTLRRKVFPGGHLLHVRAIANRLARIRARGVSIEVSDPAGPVLNAQVSVSQNGAAYAAARTPKSGKLQFALPRGKYKAMIAALGRPVKMIDIDTEQDTEHKVSLEACGYVAAKITGADGGPIPCKVAFHGKDGTETPYFGPNSGDVTVHNLHYSHNGQFTQPIGPGKYEVIISYGPEYDAVFTDIEVQRGNETKLAAKLVRTVDTTGWVSSDFHSHSSPSGDNTSSQLGRVLNLLCENVEFCPCTEHNRISTYVPHLRRLEVERLMATCSGMELTGSPLPANHHNAFPLVRKPHTQDGGGPVIDVNPAVQIERLAMWDDGSDKLVQQNHPNIVQILRDRDTNGRFDGGWEKMFSFMDVIEVHPPVSILTAPESAEFKSLRRNPIFHWMQLLNMGYRIPGVVNTDAHYNFHESGWLRNFIKSSTDDPAEVKTMDMVHAAERGNLIMSNGPFMEVAFTAADSRVTAGDDIAAPGGTGKLHVRVQCANWIDINRVQVFLNGRMAENLNLTRRAAPGKFSDGVVKFDQTLDLELDGDTHVIVAAAGEGLQLGRVMGPTWGKKVPIAVSNPIFVDVDGGGFKPNGDLLGVALPEE